MVRQGFNLQPRAATASRNLTLYGWNGRCFTNLSSITWAARYQCPGKIGNYANGCQGSVSKQTGSWGKSSMGNGASSVVCITGGSEGPKDANGCFTQQLDVDNGSAGSPEGFYSFDSCGSKPVPTDPKVPEPTAPPVEQPKGYVDVLNCSGIAGWAWNVNNPRYVHFYVDKPSFAGSRVNVDYFEVEANGSRTDVPGVFPQIPPNVGWFWDGGPLKNDGRTHKLYVYVTDRGDNWAPLLGGEGIDANFTCPVPPTPTPTPIPNATPTPTVPPTPTIACVKPSAPTNVRVTCEICQQ